MKHAMCQAFSLVLWGDGLLFKLVRQLLFELIHQLVRAN